MAAEERPHIAALYSSAGEPCIYGTPPCGELRTVAIEFNVLDDGGTTGTAQFVLCQAHLYEFLGRFAFGGRGIIEEEL